MEQQSLEYTKLPAAEAAKKAGRAAPVSAANPAVAAAVVTCVAAGALVLLHAPHTPPPQPGRAAAPAAPAASASVSSKDAAAARPLMVQAGPAAETRGASPLPVAPAGAAPETASALIPPAEPNVPEASGGAAGPARAAAAVGAALAAARSLPAWAAAAGVQRWVWPKSVGEKVSPDGLPHSRLVSWDPHLPEGQRAQYELLADGRWVAAPRVQHGMMPMRMDIEQVRALELAALAKQKRAVSFKDVRTDPNRPMAELTYADGHKEVVPYDPLVFDLRGSGVKTDDRRVLFDLYGSGQADKLQWMSNLDGGTGILVFDADGSGKSGKTGAEVFGDRTDLTGVGRPTGFANGFEALRALVRKAADEGVLPRASLQRGLLDAKDLAALEKAYGLRLKVGGFNAKPVSLARAGIQAIALSDAPTERLEDFDGRGNSLVVQPGAVFLRADGTTGTYMNAWLKANEGAPKLAARKFMYAP